MDLTIDQRIAFQVQALDLAGWYFAFRDVSLVPIEQMHLHLSCRKDQRCKSGHTYLCQIRGHPRRVPNQQLVFSHLNARYIVNSRVRWQLTNLGVCADLKRSLTVLAFAQERPDRSRIILVYHLFCCIESNTLCNMIVACATAVSDMPDTYHQI